MCAAATTSLPETPGGERNWDYRYSWIRDSAFMLWGLHSLGFAQEAGDYYYFIEDVASRRPGPPGPLRDRRRARDRGARAAASRGLRALAAGARRQRRLQPEPARRLGHAAGLGLHPHAEPRPATRELVADPRRARSSRRSSTGASATAASGRCAASPSTSPPRRSSAGSPATAVRASRGCATPTARPTAGRRRPTRSARTFSPTASTRTNRFVQHYETDGARRVAAAAAADPLPAARRRAHPQHGLRDRRRAEPRRPRPALPRRGDRRRARLRGGRVRDLLVLARRRAGRDRRPRSRPRAVREAARLREPARPLRRGDRRRDRPPPRQLPAGVHAPLADQRDHAADSRRGGDARRGALAGQGRAAVRSSSRESRLPS